MAEKIRKEKDGFEAGPLEAGERGLALGRGESPKEERHLGGPDQLGALADVGLAGGPRAQQRPHRACPVGTPGLPPTCLPVLTASFPFPRGLLHFGDSSPHSCIQI